MPPNDLKRLDSYQYPAAHLGHLTENQQSSLDTFKKLCQDAGYYGPAGVDGRSEPSHDDETLLRYLRARRFNPPEALKQFKDTEDWRKENHLEELYDTIDVQEYEQTRQLYPQWTGRRDRRGIPVYLFEVAHLNSKNIAAYEKSVAKGSTVSHQVPAKMLRLFALYENLCRFVMPLCSAVTSRNHPETPISQSNNIVDISKVGLKQFWNLKGHMQDASTLATAHYPETLDRIFIIGAPSFFPTVWGWVKRWFDPITVSKIFILSSSDMKSTLEQYIDPASIPKKYGGQLDFEFGQMPVLEPEIASALEWQTPAPPGSSRTIPTGPIKWIEGSDGRVSAVAVGSENGKPRQQVVATLKATDSIRSMHGALNNATTPLNELDLQLGVGTATQPLDTGAADTDSPPPSETPSEPASAPATPKQVYEKSLPIREAPSQSSSMRQGTSDTRFDAQHATHAQGQLADGTPAVNDHGYGDKTVTMEPNTVGQAPKDVSIPSAEESAPGYLEQAQNVAAQASATVSSAANSAAGAVSGLVGGGKKEEKTEPEPAREKNAEERWQEKAIDDAPNQVVEGYLREQASNSANS